jgi:L,D-peptidoglycan transpeptidase YkuD (ErfK/YbiS/YcfS/YnhG family)
MTIQRRGGPLLAAAIALVLASGCASPADRRAAPIGTSSGPAPTATPTTRPRPTTTVARLAPATTRRTAPPTTARSPATAAPPTAPRCPSNLASSLASTGQARQLVIATATGYGTSVATVSLWQKSGACWEAAGGPWPARIGFNGFSDHHREGDDTTPTGIYGIGPTMYGNAPNPGVRAVYHLLVCGDWWDEDPTSPAYNTFQHVGCGQRPPFGGGSEALWTETSQYPSFAVVEYNTDPIVAYAGSAIFIHRDTGSPTTGCISIPLAQLDELLRWIDPAEAPAIAMGPASEIVRF